jgi:hypothetical protein
MGSPIDRFSVQSQVPDPKPWYAQDELEMAGLPHYEHPSFKDTTWHYAGN